jgi:hypothetical protein
MADTFGGQEVIIYGNRNDRKHRCIAIGTYLSLYSMAKELGFFPAALKSALGSTRPHIEFIT